MDLYRLAIQEGMAADPRRGPELDELLERTGQAYDRLQGGERERFDADSLWNPYADSRIVSGDPEAEVSRVMWGIDINVPELLLADRLREKGQRIDAVIGHHPRGRAAASLHHMVHIRSRPRSASWGRGPGRSCARRMPATIGRPATPPPCWTCRSCVCTSRPTCSRSDS